MHRPIPLVSQMHFRFRCYRTPKLGLARGKPCVALADQVKSFDWRVRPARRKGKVSDGELTENRAKARALLGK